MAELCLFIFQAMTASIEALLRRVPLSMDKYYHATCSTRKEQLGLVVDTHEIIVELPDNNRKKIDTMLSHWYAGRKSFTVLQAAQLLGTLEHAATVAPWLRYQYDSLRHSLLAALRVNEDNVYKNITLEEFLNDMTYKGSSHEGLLKKNFASSFIAKTIWHSRKRHFVTKALSKELTFLHHIFSDTSAFRLFTPICYLVDRSPDFIAKGDACLDGAGGFSLDLSFWWFFEWPPRLSKN